VINNLHPMIAEQWIYRHWKHSPYCYLPIERLRWRQEEWDVATVRNVFVRPDFGFDNPEQDFAIFHTKQFEKAEPHKSLNLIGTWNYPIVVMHTPDGILPKEKSRLCHFA
jgi:hypothetical protein